jgi:hypothetical protein
MAKMNAQAQALLIKEFNKTAEAMVDVEHIANILKDGMDTDIKEGDTIIGTHIYKCGLFKVSELKKATKERDDKGKTIYQKLPNPYQEFVRKNDQTSRSKNLTIKAHKDDEDSYWESRVKVSRLAMFRWDEETNSYPILGEPIIFREKIKSFAEENYWAEMYYERLLNTNDPWFNEERKTTATKYLELIKRLSQIPPFVCYWNELYGFLVKRNVVMRQIVYGCKNQIAEPAFSLGPERLIANEVKKTIDDFKAHLTKRNEGSSFKEEIVKEALNPSRVEAVMDKHGMEGVDATFDPSAEGVGRRR